MHDLILLLVKLSIIDMSEFGKKKFEKNFEISNIF